MDALRRGRFALGLLLCGLVLLSSAERRLAYLDFNSDHSTRVENNDRPDGDEIIKRLVFVDDSTEPIVPPAGDACCPGGISLASSARSLTTIRLSEDRAPPFVISSQV